MYVKAHMNYLNTSALNRILTRQAWLLCYSSRTSGRQSGQHTVIKSYETFLGPQFTATASPLSLEHSNVYVLERPISFCKAWISASLFTSVAFASLVLFSCYGSVRSLNLEKAATPMTNSIAVKMLSNLTSAITSPVNPLP